MIKDFSLEDRNPKNDLNWINSTKSGLEQHCTFIYFISLFVSLCFDHISFD